MNSQDPSSPPADVQGNFDLRDFAKQIKPKIASYEELIKTNRPDFMKWLSGVRERLKRIKHSYPAGKKMIIVVGTGGTFQSAPGPSGYEPTGTLQESFDALGLPEDPDIHLDLCDLMNLDSSQLTHEQWRFLAEMIIELEGEAGDLYDAIIVTHGTDTMADGASYLSFMLKGFPKSIIFTGSQEPARQKGSDAKDQMQRAIATAKISCNVDDRIAEVMIACGLQVSRGTWGAKRGDVTVDTFGPWNDPRGGFTSSAWAKAIREGTLHRLAPALLDFGKGESQGSMEFAPHARRFRQKGPFEPFTKIESAADVIPAPLTDVSPEAIANHLINQRVAVFTQLGAATAKDELVDVVVEGANRGKIVVYEAAFPDSTVTPGKYKAGAGMKQSLPYVLRPSPIINTSPSTFRAKPNYLMNKLGIKPAGKTEGLGYYYSAEDVRKFYDAVEQNLIGELVSD